MSVLLIEDDSQLNRLYTSIIAEFSSIDSCRNAADALALLEENSYKLVILDLMMPEMDGFEFLDKFHALEIDEIPNIVVMTNLNSGFDRDRLRKHHVKEVLLKLSTGPDELQKIIDTYT